MSSQKYPQYYCVDFDIFVKLVKKGKQIFGYNHLGNPYSIGKAIVDGRRITKAQYEKGIEDYRQEEKSKEATFQTWVKKQAVKFNNKRRVKK